MVSYIRPLLMIGNAIFLLLLIEMRQTSQSLFIELQSLNKQYIEESQTIDQLKIDYLTLFNQVPARATETGLIMPTSLPWL